MQEAWDAGGSCRVEVSISAVQTRIDQLRNGAQPGMSRTKNDMLGCIASAPGGRASLRTWCQLWADGKIPDRVAELLTQQLLRPLRKPNGKPRPIALLE
eukprot:11212721-Karenia_brevis.AAC.1